jgi:hypothetical protein|tara:strand:- start:1795 stop:2058 length:264 start_codon:yes stop_codon:yes gene_type:complete
MATREGALKMAEEIREEEKINPLLKKSLGELIRDMQIMVSEDPNVLRPREEVPTISLDRHEKYQEIVEELGRRESNYNSYIGPPRFD